MATCDDGKNSSGSRRTKTYGRRKGKTLRRGQKGALAEVMPAFSFDPATLAEADGLKSIAAAADVRIEIGFGGGEHLAHAAQLEPDVLFIGCEPFINGVAKIAAAIVAGKLRNIRLYPGDAMDVLDGLPEASVRMIYVLYPDPWPKARQRKRRFVNAESLRAMARVLKPGGELRFVTDIDDYCAWTLARILQSGDFRWVASEAANWLTPWPHWPGTRYENKARREGRSSAYLTFLRT